MPREKTYELIREALAKPGCAVCRLGTESVQRYLAGFMYEDVTDVGLRAKMRTAQGFCRDHAAQAILVRDSLGLAIIYQDFLGSVRKEINEALPAPRLPSPGILRRAPAPGRQIAQRIAPQRACPACAVRDALAAAGLRTLLHNIGEADFSAAFQASDGLCLPHLRRALAEATSSAAVAALIDRQTQVIKRLDGQLAEFIRKHDYRFRQEPMGGERDSWQRAIDMATGQPAADKAK